MELSADRQQKLAVRLSDMIQRTVSAKHKASHSDAEHSRDERRS